MTTCGFADHPFQPRQGFVSFAGNLALEKFADSGEEGFAARGRLLTVIGSNKPLRSDIANPGYRVIQRPPRKGDVQTVGGVVDAEKVLDLGERFRLPWHYGSFFRGTSEKTHIYADSHWTPIPPQYRFDRPDSVLDREEPRVGKTLYDWLHARDFGR